jgi:ATP-binding cassette subfamily B (MDR/TAP) protein 1
LTQRIRARAFEYLLRQEIAYFDRPENSSGAICARLSSDALAVQQMTSTRLGYIFEVIAMFGCGLVFSFFISFQLALILFSFILLVLFLACAMIHSQAHISKCSSFIFQRASSVNKSN